MPSKTSLSYDALDRLIGITPFGEATIQDFYNREHLSTEVQASRRFSILRSTEYVHAQQRIESSGRLTALLVTDVSRSVLTEVQDARFSPFAYMPYGYRQPVAGMNSLLAFNGERPNAVTGHYLLGNGRRAFNPILMRFNSPDKLSPFGRGGLNAFAYCKGDPINFNDPSGQFFQSILGVLQMVHPVLKIGWKSYALVLRPSGRGLGKLATLTTRTAYMTTAVGAVIGNSGYAMGKSVTAVGGGLLLTGKTLKLANKLITVVTKSRYVRELYSRFRQLQGQPGSAALDAESRKIRTE